MYHGEIIVFFELLFLRYEINFVTKYFRYVTLEHKTQVYL